MSTCLQQLGNVRPATSPLSRLVAFEVYDGPTSGLAECESTGESFLFRLLAWDEEQHLRAFSFAPVPADVASHAIATLSTLENPRWPEWWLKAGAEDAGRTLVNQAVSTVLQAASLPVCVVLTHDLLGQFVSAVAVSDTNRAKFLRLSRTHSTEAEVSDGTFGEWRAFIAGE